MPAKTTTQARVIIENVSPQIDGGRFPIKRVPGEGVIVRADVYAEGHEAINANVLYRKKGDKAWQKALMTFLINDSWEGHFTIDNKVDYEYTVESWINHFKTWQQGLRKKVEAFSDVKVDILYGIQLLEHIVSSKKDKNAAKINNYIKKIKSASKTVKAAEWALKEELLELTTHFPDKDTRTQYPKALLVQVQRKKALFSSWYEFFPRSFGNNGTHGTFKECESILPEIAKMGFDVVYLPPIHPIGHTNRKGKNNAVIAKPDDVGSPWAIGGKEGGHKSIHPKLGTMKDFKGFIKKAESLGMEVAIDLAFQCSRDHPYVKEHPEWFIWRPDGSIQYAENPPKKYEDVLPINFGTRNRQALWNELKSVVIFWIKEGIHIFRVDNPHTKPFSFWEWLIKEVKEQYPDTIFLSEAFTRPKVMAQLAKLGFDQSYTYFTWRTSKWDFTQYITELTQTQLREYFRPNFWPNTPDILPHHLQYGGRPAFIQRLILAATLSSNYGMYGPAYELCIHEGVPEKEEYFNSEKYELKSWNSNQNGHIIDIVTKVNQIRRENPALQTTWNTKFCEIQNEGMLAYYKATEDLENILLIVVNLDPHNTQSAWMRLPINELDIAYDRQYKMIDQISLDEYYWQGEWNYVQLNPFVLPAHIFKVQKM